MVTYLPYELHCHTVHSDGKMTPAELAAEIKKDGLVGFAITDHNTASGVVAAKEAGRAQGLNVIGGIEWTTFYGHITVLGSGVEYAADWRQATPETVETLAKSLCARGAAVGVAHPYRIGYPVCTGGSDDWGLERYEGFTHYEVYSYPSPLKNPTNRAAVERYFRLAAAGVKLAAVYGRDFHARSNGAYGVTFIGTEREGEAGVLTAIKAGRTYMSTGVTLSARLVAGGKEIPFGGEPAAGEAEFCASAALWRQDYTARYGVAVKTLTLSGTALEAPITLPASGGEVRLNLKEGYLAVTAEGEIEGDEGLLALATPYFVSGGEKR